MKFKDFYIIESTLMDIVNKWRKEGIRLKVKETKKKIYLQDIIVPEKSRGSGTGSKVIQDLVDYADSQNKLMTTTPDDVWGGDKKRLIPFYKKFGFIENKGKDEIEEPEEMYRIPNVNEDSEDYKMDHEAPDKQSGYPLHDVIGAYSKDFYGFNGYKYYAQPEAEYGGKEAYDIIYQKYKRPNSSITVYRAVPKNVKKINKGDWVTLVRQYAKQHGEDQLDGNYKIIKDTVKARDLFTDGNSIVEWGYDPQPEDPKEKLKFNVRRKLSYMEKRLKNLDLLARGELIIGWNKYSDDPYYQKDITKEINIEDEKTKTKKEIEDLKNKYKNLDYEIIYPR